MASSTILSSQRSFRGNRSRDKLRHPANSLPTNINAANKNIANPRSFGSMISLKSILSNKLDRSAKSGKNCSTDCTTSSSETSHRRARFDQQNIDLTYKPSRREYGHLRITQAATPFPRKKELVPRSTVRPNMSELFNEEKRRSILVTLPRPFSSVYFDAPLQMDFLTKRKIFHRGEYTLTRQRRPIVVHPPLKSIQPSTRPQTSCIALTEYFRKHYSQRQHGSVTGFGQI